MLKIWCTLIILRVLWTLYGQTGYIHPDEFFQSIEVISADLQIQSYRTWEFNETFPIRSTVLPYTLYWIPIFLSSVLETKLLIQTQWLLILTRLVPTVISILCDFFLIKLNRKLNLNPCNAALVLATSYVAVVYFTRTLSNSIEAFLFFILLYRVIDETCYSRIIDTKRSVSPGILSLIMILGIFNRPTFIVFAIVPILYWLFFNKKVTAENNYLNRIRNIFSISLQMSVYISLLSSIFIIIDTMYYSGITVEDLFYELTTNNLSSYISILKVTPFNFLLYNIHPENVELHGLHPHFLHILVNMPLLFNFLWIVFLYEMFYFFILKKCMLNNGNRQLEFFLILSIWIPLMILSFIPHQEPRFLLPLIFPLIILCANHAYEIKEILNLWLLVNVICAIFYGCMHQGGVTNSLQKFKVYATKQQSFTVIYYKTYMPPRSLMNIHSSTDSNDMPCSYAKGIQIIDLMGSSRSKLDNLLNDLSICYTELDSRQEVFLVTPSSIQNISANGLSKTRFILKERISPHLTLEDLPTISDLLHCEKTDGCQLKKDFYILYDNIRRLISLSIFQVKFN